MDKRRSTAERRRSTSTNRSSQIGLPALATERSRSADPARPWNTNTPRQKDRFVPLPAYGAEPVVEEDELDLLIEDEPVKEHALVRADSRLQSLSAPGRIGVKTVCASFDREKVIQTLSLEFPTWPTSRYPEVVYIQADLGPDTGLGDVFVFDYGVVVCWLLSPEQEAHIHTVLAPCQVKPLAQQDVQVEELGVVLSADQVPHIQNDCITISKRDGRDHQVKLAVSHALAQSCKLSVHERRVWELVEQVIELPESLAEHGEIRLSQKAVTQLMGTVFIQKAEVNLLSSVLDTPEFFWSAPDQLQVLYNKVAEYLDLEARVTLVNSRTMLIQSMLRIWTDHKAQCRMARLDRIIIILIVVEVIMAAAEVVGFFVHVSNKKG